MKNNTDIAIIRSYAHEIIAKVNCLKAPVQVDVLGEVKYFQHCYPFFRITVAASSQTNLKSILLSAGVHGDEPAGIYTILKFLEDHIEEFLDKYRFVIYPCVNPSAFEASTLETMNGANLNRLFTPETSQTEIHLIIEDLLKLNLDFQFAMDLHEAPPYYEGEGYLKKDNPHACWIYESRRDECERLGRGMIDTLPPDIEVCTWPFIYHDISDRGVINFLAETTGNPVYAEGTTFDAFVFERYTGHSFTTETPTGWSMEKRVRTQLHFLLTALRNCS